jgi:hypothetical protein
VGSEVTSTLIDELLANKSAGLEEVLNTASSLGDIPVLFATQKEAEQLFDDASSMPSGSTGSGDAESTLDSEDSHSTPCEEIFNTASTFQDLEFDAAQQPPLPEHTGTTDRLQSLRLQGSTVQQRIAQNDIQPSPVISARGQQTPGQFIVAIQTPDGIRPGLVTLLGDASTETQPQYPTPPPNHLPVVHGGLSAPVAPAPAAAPVLRLADAIATPEVGTEELPSIGSLMHHKGECKPCTFFHTRGCENGDNCKFCHLCGPKEKKKRIKAQKAVQREANFMALENAKVALACMRAAQGQGLQVETIVE